MHKKRKTYNENWKNNLFSAKTERKRNFETRLIPNYALEIKVNSKNLCKPYRKMNAAVFNFKNV